MPEKILIPLGLAEARVRPGEHIAYFWKSDQEFERGVDFLIAGLRDGDHTVVFGHPEANEKVCAVLKRRGFDPQALVGGGQLTILGPESTGDATLHRIGTVFQAALDRGTSLIRLLGNIGWGKPGWPNEREILEFEAKVTGAARQFPCVVVCMYDVQSLPGTVILHGAFETHPFTVCGNIMRENTHYVDAEIFLRRRADEPER